MTRPGAPAIRGWAGIGALLLAGASMAAQPLVIAPVVEGLFSCGVPGAPDVEANSYCVASGGKRTEALRRLLDELEPGGARGKVQVGYVLTVQLLGLYLPRGNGWTIDESRLQAIASLLREVDRPVVLYLASNHFDTQGPLAAALGRDPRNLMQLADGKPPVLDYFGYQVLPYTLLTDPTLPVNRYRFGALRLLSELLAKMPAALQDRLVGVALGGELHQMFPDFSAGMGDHRQHSVTDYSPASVAAFRAWLARRYGSVERLNAAAGSRFDRFDAVPAPARNAFTQPDVAHAEHYDAFAGGTVPVHGWLWDPDRRVQGLELHVDGKAHAEIPLGFNRLDVYRAVAEVTDPNVGFRHDLDFSRWRPGSYRLEVVARTADGNYLVGERRLLVEGLQAPRTDSLLDRLQARLRPSLQPITRPLKGARVQLDLPGRDLRVLFNPLARDWNTFRAAQVQDFMAQLHRIALAAGVPAGKIFSHQILPRVNSSWNADLFATDGTVAAALPWKQGFNTYGGATAGAWTQRFLRSAGITDYGLPEFHPQQWKRPDAALAALRAHQQLGARFVSPYYMSIVSDQRLGATAAVKALEIRPNNPQDGSDLLFQAIRTLATE